MPNNYFRVLQSRFVEGVGFSGADERGETDAIVIGKRAAEAFWPGTSAIGKRFRLDPSAPWRRVVGVVANQGAVTGTPWERLQLFYPETETLLHARRGIIVRVEPGVRTDRVLETITSVLRSIDRKIPIAVAKSEVDIINDARARPRFVTTILSLFAALALFLAAFGLYGVISYAVSQRVREIGIRVALGARSVDVTRLVVGNGLRLTLIGTAVGIVGAGVASRVLRGMLYGVTPLDPAVFALMPALLVGVALLASYVPARRAARVDPLVALRHE